MNHWQSDSANPRGYIGFGGGAVRIAGQANQTVHTYATALLGLVASYNKSIQFLEMTTREWQLGWYFRDRWQVNRRLTLTLGLRYEYYPLMNRADRGLERWDPETNIVYVGGFGDVPWDAGLSVSKKLFAPRLGIAYRATDRWVIRTGYGLTFDPMPFSRPLRNAYPATLVANWSAGAAGAAYREGSYGWYNTIAEGIPAVPTPDLSTGKLTLPLDFSMGPRSPWGGEIHRGYIQSWNFIVQRQLPFDMNASAGYVATRTVHQLMDRNINTGGPGTVDTSTLPLARLYGKTRSADMWDGFGSGSYHSLQATLDKSLSRGLFLKGAYTYSKVRSMTDDDGWAGLAIWHWEPMIHRNYAPAGYDRRQAFTLAWVYELPFGRGRRYGMSGPMDFILGGWRVNGQFSAYTGTPFSITAAGESLRCVGCSQTVDQVGEARKIDKGRGVGQYYIDPAAFADPLWTFDKNNPVYRAGNTGRNFLYGPGFWRWDPMLSKIFTVKEGFTAEFRAKADNGTNTPRWDNPDTGIGQVVRDPATGKVTDYKNFMAITGAGSLRQMRLGLRLSF